MFHEIRSFFQFNSSPPEPMFTQNLRVKHLKLYRACVDEDFTIVPLDRLATP